MKILLEILPLLAFFVCYKFLGLVGATYAIIIASIISMCLHYVVFKKIPKAMIISACLITIMGSATILSGNSSFIKIKPTIFFLVISGVLMYGLYFKKYYVKMLFGKVFNMPDDAWIILSKRIVLFFVLMAVLNEVVWRLFSDDVWVYFKVFGFLPIMIAFMLFQMPLFNKYQSKI